MEIPTSAKPSHAEGVATKSSEAPTNAATLTNRPPITAVSLLRAMFDVGYFPPNTPPPIE
jgi:hypothetical protein